jgi:hypothetical protein
MRSPAAYGVGAKLHARDRGGYWYAAKIMDKTADQPAKFFVQFQGFPKSHNEWVLKSHLRINATKAQIVEVNAVLAWPGSRAGLDAASGTWSVDQILKKKVCHGVVKYHCTWEGHGADHATWEPRRNLPSWLVADFERSQKRGVGEDPPTRAAATRVPFVHTATEGTDASVRREHAPVTQWLQDVARVAGEALPKQKCSKLVPFPRVMCPAWAFVDLRHMIYVAAEELALDVPTEQLVTPIASERGGGGGKNVTDSFYITSYDVLHVIMGMPDVGALVLRANRTAVMLVPPLKFAFKTVRAAGARQSLVVTAEFGALVWGSRLWDFNAMHVTPPKDEDGDERAEREAAQDATMHNHKRGIKAAVVKLAASKDGVVPPAMLEWLQVV